MKTLRAQSLARAHRQAVISAPIALDKRRTALGYDALAESEQQFQLPIEGIAQPTLAWGTTELVFDMEFFDAPEQRDSSLVVPLFTFGAFIEATVGPADNPTGAVMVTACVQAWNVDDRGAYIGATVAVGVMASAAQPYSGYVHLAFQGYGALSENVPTLDVGT